MTWTSAQLTAPLFSLPSCQPALTELSEPECDPWANIRIRESTRMEYFELTISCFSITRWESKETWQFDLDSPVMNHLENCDCQMDFFYSQLDNPRKVLYWKV